MKKNLVENYQSLVMLSSIYSLLPLAIIGIGYLEFLNLQTVFILKLLITIAMIVLFFIFIKAHKRFLTQLKKIQ